MSKYKYSKKIENETQAFAVLRDGRVSTKQAIEIANFIKGKEVEKAKSILEEAIKLKKAIPLKRFSGGVGHRKGKIGAGRYMVKACSQILDLIKNCEANAQFKGLSSSDLIVKHMSAQKGAQTWHYGRKSRRKVKNTHIEIVLEEVKKEKTTKTEKKGISKTEEKKVKVLEEEKKILQEEKKIENQKPKQTDFENEVQEEIKEEKEKILEKERIDKEKKFEKISDAEKEASKEEKND